VTPADAELVDRVLASDDRAAFGELVRRHQSAVRYFLRHLCRSDAALADDLAQDTFVQAHRGLAGYRRDAAFPTWLLGIAHNYWRNARRRAREHDPLDERIPEDATSGAIQQSDLRHDLDLALRELSADEQLAIHLCYQQGQSHQEIAALLDWPLGTVKTHLLRAKEKLRQPLAAWNPQT
jgi:RNA polymerase sigma factor (sigma-70 family)